MSIIAILLCGIAAMIIGSVWHGPLFGNTQREFMGSETMTAEEKEKMKKAMGGMFAIQFVISLITAAVLDYFIGGSPLIIGLIVAVIMWFGFIVTTTAGSALWSGKPVKMQLKMFFVSTGGQLITFVVYALIIGAFK